MPEHGVASGVAEIGFFQTHDLPGILSGHADDRLWRKKYSSTRANLDVPARERARRVRSVEFCQRRKRSYQRSIGCGVYLLLHKLQCVYVGESKQVEKRIGSHRPGKRFDRSVFITVEGGENKLVRLSAERMLIAYLCPILNKPPRDRLATPFTISDLVRLANSANVTPRELTLSYGIDLAWMAKRCPAPLSEARPSLPIGGAA